MSEFCRSFARTAGVSLLLILLACQPKKGETPLGSPTITHSAAVAPSLTSISKPAILPTATDSFVPLSTATPPSSGILNPVISVDQLEKLGVVRQFGPFKAQIDGAIPSPDGKLIAVFGSYDPEFELVDIKTGQVAQTFPGAGRGVRKLSFDPDGSRIASLSYGDGQANIQLWNVTNGRLLWTNTVDDKLPKDLAYSPDARNIASISAGIRVWDAVSGKELRKLDGGSYPNPYALGFDPLDGHRLAASSDLNTQLWDITTGRLLKTIEPLPGSALARAVGFSPNGRCLAIGYADKTIELWDLSKSAGHVEQTDFDLGLTFSPLNGSGLFANLENTGGQEQKSTIKFWHSENPSEPCNMQSRYRLNPPQESDQFESVAFTSDGRYLVTAVYSQSLGNMVYVWAIPP